MSAAQKLYGLLLIFTATIAPAQAFVTVSTGHAGAVRAVTMHPSEPVVYTAGDDGRVLGWDLSVGGLVRQAQLATVPLTRIAHHPSRNQVAAFARDSLTGGRLIVWDWEREEVLFEQPLDAVPQLLQFSPGGTFVLAASTSFDSLSFFSSQTGNVRPHLSEGFGAVSFVQIARSERNILTYVPTRGEFIYWELQTGRELQVVETERRVNDLTPIDPQNQRLLVGYTDEELLILDNLTGGVEARYPIAPVTGISFSAERQIIYALTEPFGEPKVEAFRYANGRLRPVSFRDDRLDQNTTRIFAVDGFPTQVLISGSQSGEVAMYAETTGRKTVLGSSDYVLADGVNFVGNRLGITAGNRIVWLESDLFTDSNQQTSNRVEMSFLRDTATTIQSIDQIESTVDDESLVIWGNSVPGTLWRVDPLERRAEVIFERPEAGAIRRVRPQDNGLLIVFRDGLITLLDEEMEPVFEYRNAGAQDAVWDDDIGLVIAQAEGSLFGSSIVVVDPATGETVPASNGAFLTRTLEVDTESNRVYAVSLSGDQTRATAEIVRYSGPGLGQRTSLFSSEPGRTGGAIAWDTATLWTTLLPGRVSALSGELAGTDAIGPRNPVAVAAGELVLASANSDGTVSLFWKETGRHLADVVLFEEGWIITAGRGFLASNDRLESYLTVVPIGDQSRPVQLSELELRLPLLLRPDF